MVMVDVGSREVALDETKVDNGSNIAARLTRGASSSNLMLMRVEEISSVSRGETVCEVVVFMAVACKRWLWL